MNKQILKLREKFIDTHDYLLKSYFVNHPDINLNEEYYNSVILFSLISGILKKNLLIYGNYGLGKTTLAMAISSLLYRFPIEIIEGSIIQGHPQITEEKIIGRLDFSKLNKEEKVLFSMFSQLPAIKIIDEINRIPEGTQNILLNFIDNGHFYYLNDSICSEKYPFFATTNYKDEGNTDLTPPLLDRFDLSVEVKFPLFLTSYLRNLEYKNKELKSLLKNEDLSKEVHHILNDKDLSYEEKMIQLKEPRNAFLNLRKELVFSDDEIKQLRAEVAKVEFDYDAELFVNAFFDSMNQKLKNFQNTSTLNLSHDTKYLFSSLKNNLSIRAAVNSLSDYLKFISFLKDPHKKIEIFDILLVLPYILNHRLQFKDEFLKDIEIGFNESLSFAATKKLVNDFYKQEFLKQRDFYNDLYIAIKNNSKDDFLKKYAAHDNPLKNSLAKL